MFISKKEKKEIWDSIGQAYRLINSEKSFMAITHNRLNSIWQGC